MTVFGCVSCGVVVTAEVSEVPYPDGEVVVLEERAEAPPRVRQGTFAVAPEPFGPPYEPLPDRPQVLVSAGPRATILVHPDDVVGLRHHPDPSRLNGCCRLDGADGLNLVCGGCGAEIATEVSDCWASWHDLRLHPDAVAVVDERGGTGAL